MTMDVAVVGAGAMGSLLAHHLISADVSVSVIDRPQRAAMVEANGLRVLDPDGAETSTRPARVSDSIAAAGPHDLVILATKAYDLPLIAPEIGGLLHSDSVVLTLQNGLPWWYFDRHAPLPDLRTSEPRLHSLDPSGTLRRAIPAEQIIGCVAYPAANLRADGSVQHVEGDKFPIGELDGVIRPRTQEISALLETAGFRSRILEDIRSELWLKAWGALSLNPISALTHGTMSGICEFEPTRTLVATMMAEAQSVAEALGIEFRHTIEKRIAGAHGVGAHKTSMLQDREAGRPMEIDALVGAILELAELTRTPVPAITAVHACASLLNNTVCASSAHS